MDDSNYSAPPIKVLIADDHPLFLAGVRRALDRSGVEVVGEAGSVAELMGLVERRRPEVVLLDLRMPGVEGTEHISRLRSAWPEVKVVVLSASDDQPSIDAALEAGASAFVIKSVRSTDVAAILRQVASGGVFHAPSRPVEPNGVSEAGRAGPQLSERERCILAAAARGLTTTAISSELFISEHTVKFHLTNVYRKLGVSNRAAAVRWALEHGLS
jgi:DNA-binding NarL/FixJ family response regulator